MLRTSHFQRLAARTIWRGSFSTAAAPAAAHNAMFCFQCEQTYAQKGCSTKGVCGKSPTTAQLQDLSLHFNTGIGELAKKITDIGGQVPEATKNYLLESTFATLTNVNFDSDRFEEYLRQGAAHRDMLVDTFTSLGGDKNTLSTTANFAYEDKLDFLLMEGKVHGVLARKQVFNNADVTGLREMAQYGLKGLMAYWSHAERIRRQHPEAYSSDDRELVFSSIYNILDSLTRTSFTVDEVVALNMRVGETNLKVMELLDAAHTSTFGHPVPTVVSSVPVKGRCILVSGHDLMDLYKLLVETEHTGINVYTHGEMLPAHGYPGLKKFNHLVGHYGNAWQRQRQDFGGFPGPILMTSNCIIEPLETYRNRIFTTNSTGVHGVTHLPNEDFAKVIDTAKQSKIGFTGQEQYTSTSPTFTVGFGGATVLSLADKLVGAVKSGHVGGIFLIGGCDGNEAERSYYTELAKNSPANTLILTLGCTKYRINGLGLDKEMLDLGGVQVPRLLDMGQCNDAYSSVKVALALAAALECDVNDLPLHLAISWFEQKAVAVLLTLLYLNVKNICLGPQLPAFLTPNMLEMLSSKFNLRLVDVHDAKSDLRRMMEPSSSR